VGEVKHLEEVAVAEGLYIILHLLQIRRHTLLLLAQLAQEIRQMSADKVAALALALSVRVAVEVEVDQLLSQP
jgi:hypothetical protein